MQSKLISIVIPCYNEEKNIDRTLDEILTLGNNNKLNLEIIAVNDGSKDNTWEVIKKYAQKHDNITAINQMANFGQSTAYQAGFDTARGDFVITVSADLEIPIQNISKVIEHLEKGADFVNTNRVGRWNNNNKTKGLGLVKSGSANKLIKAISGVDIKDRGSGMKGLTKPVAKSLKLYGEMHRFIPDYVSIYGAKIAEFDVDFRDRDYGKSYYKGHQRTIKVLLDLVTLTFMLYFAKKPFSMMPGRFFGFTGALMSLTGFTITLFLAMEKLFLGVQIGNRPLLLAGMLLMVLGIIMFMLGMIGELVMRIYFEATNRKTYMVREVVGSKVKI